MNSETLFSLALGLQPPWQVKDVTFSTDELARSELHLHIDFMSGARFLDDANNLCPVHDTVERQWQHLSFFEHTCYLHCAVPRLPRPMVKSGLLALCEIQWVIKLQLSAKEINHINEVIDIAITSGSPFSQLNLAIDAFKNAVRNV